MPSRIMRWINERWPLDAVIRWSLEEEMPGGTSYAYVFGSAVLLTFFLQVVTGVFQFVYLVPTVDHAYDSLNYLRIQVPFGWLVHGLHYWGAVAMLILVGLHMCANFIFGAYKHPRQLTWVIGVCLLLATQAQVFTGPVLPWDERGYWEGEVGTSITGTVPIIGDFLMRFLRGGYGMSQLTLSRFFVLHAAVIPAILLALIPLHIVAFRRFGVAGPWDEARRRITGHFWPEQVFKDGLVFACIVVALIGISVYIPPPIAGPADPTDTSYVPKPEWNFLFIYQALKAFHGVLEPVGTVGIPLFLILLVLLLPWYDRNPYRNPAKRPFAMTAGGVFVAIVLILAYVGYYSRPGAETAGPAPKPAVSSSTATTVPAVPVSANIEGAQLFQSQGCIGCHRIHGVGGTVGPDLSSGVLKGKDREWLITQIRNPKAHFPNTIMPSFTGPSDQQINAVVDYLLNIAAGGTLAPTAVPLPTAAVGPPSTKPVRIPAGPPGPAAYVIGSPERGVVVFTEVCISCHGPLGTDNIPNPGSDDGKVPALNPINRNLFSKDPQMFAENIDRFIQHGSTPRGPNPQFHMLPFGDDNSLTQQAISNVEAYVMQLNGVNRAELLHPGVQARYYFWVVTAAFGVMLVVFWLQRGKGKKNG